MPAIKGGYIEFERPEYERPEWGGRPVDPGWGVPEGGGGHPDQGFNPAYPDQSLPGEQPGVPPHLPDDQIVLAIHIPGRGWKHKMYPMPSWPPAGGWQPPAGGIIGRPPERPGAPDYPSVQPPRPGIPPRPGQPLPPTGRPPVAGQPLPPQRPPGYPAQPLPRPPVYPGQPLPPGGGPNYPSTGPVYPDTPDQSLPPSATEPPGAGSPPTP